MHLVLAFVVALSIAVFALASVPRFFERSAVAAFNAGATERGVADAQHMAHIFYYSIWAPVQEARPGLSFEETVHPSMMDVFSERSTYGLDLYGMNVWSLTGAPVWLADAHGASLDIGTEPWFAALTGDGMPHSSVESSGMHQMVHTYVPLRDAPVDEGRVGAVVGVLEISRDVTGPVALAAAEGLALGRRVGVGLLVIALLVGVGGWLAWQMHVRALRDKVNAESNFSMDGVGNAQSNKLATMGQLIASVAHELNNPLTAIWGVSQVLVSRDLHDPEAKEVSLIMHEAERMSRIVQNLLSFARAGDSEKTMMSLNSAVNSALELRQYHFMVNNVIVDARLDEGLPRTAADPHKIQQVVLNLITNAEQAMLAANGRGRLIVETLREDDDIVLRVKDDGPGMTEEQQKHIFDPFFTTKSAGDGTGLGLAISDAIVQEHQGSIAVETELGAGTTFTIRLPIAGEVRSTSNAVGLMAVSAQEKDSVRSIPRSTTRSKNTKSFGPDADPKALDLAGRAN